jgi:hypothetical protein
MRNILWTVMVVCLELAHGQTRLDMEGLSFEGKAYLVLEVDGTQEEIYARALTYFHKTYRSPKDVVSENRPSSITVRATQPGAVRRNSMHGFDIDYSVLVEFKDGRVRVNVPDVTMSTVSRTTTGFQRLVYVADNAFDGSVLGIYNTNGKLKSALAKSDLEWFFNDFLRRFKEGISSVEDW